MKTNTTERKKEYIKPEIEVVEFQHEARLLSASSDGPDDLPDQMDLKVH
jgi:hypothetical protein